MELEQSSKEILDYMAHLMWIRVLESNWFRKSVLKRFGTLLKTPCVQNWYVLLFQYGLCICMESAIVQLCSHQIWHFCDIIM